MATKPRRAFPGPARAPRRVPLAEGTLVLPPVSLADLPPDGTPGLFLGVLALRYATKIGSVAIFLHDLDPGDVAQILEQQRAEAEAQLGVGYARRAFWWEQK